MTRNSFSNGGLSNSGVAATFGPSAITITGTYVGGVTALRGDVTKVFAGA